MDSDDFRAILSRSGVGIWTLIDTAIKVASSDYGDELRRRRDSIVESLYSSAAQLCQNCNGNINEDVVDYNHNINTSDDVHDNDNVIDRNCNHKDDENNGNLDEDFSKSPLTPESNHRNFAGGEEEEDLDPFGGLFDDKQTKILSIKEQLEEPHQSEEAVVELLQNLADMDISFEALRETDIGRHVNQLRKHSSNEVRRLAKQLVRKWKETLDEWVQMNPPQAKKLIADGESTQQNISKIQQDGGHQVPDFGYSPNPRNGSSSAERNYMQHETKPKLPQAAPRKETPSRPPQSVPKSASAPPNKREPVLDDEKLNSARRRLQENYQEAENAKRQRTIQVMDIHEIPKPKNAFFAKNRGGSHGRHHR